MARFVEPLLEGWRLACVVRPLSVLSAGLWGCVVGLEAVASSVIVYARTHAAAPAVATGIGSVLFTALALTVVLAAAARSR